MADSFSHVEKSGEVGGRNPEKNAFSPCTGAPLSLSVLPSPLRKTRLCVKARMWRWDPHRPDVSSSVLTWAGGRGSTLPTEPLPCPSVICKSVPLSLSGHFCGAFGTRSVNCKQTGSPGLWTGNTNVPDLLGAPAPSSVSLNTSELLNQKHQLDFPTK